MTTEPLTEHEYDFVMEAIQGTAKSGTDEEQEYLEMIQEKIALLDGLPKKVKEIESLLGDTIKIIERHDFQDAWNGESPFRDLLNREEIKDLIKSKEQ